MSQASVLELLQNEYRKDRRVWLNYKDMAKALEIGITTIIVNLRHLRNSNRIKYRKTRNLYGLLTYEYKHKQIQSNNSHYCKVCKKPCGIFAYCDNHNPLKSISEKKILRIKCPKCSYQKSVYLTSYKIKRTSIAQRRFKCLKCKALFTERTEDLRKKYPAWIREQIIRLYNKKKGYIRKFDCMKKLTYSTREIAKMLDISRSGVHKVIQRRGTL